MGVELQGTKSSRDAIGAKLTLTVSSHDHRVIFGLGDPPSGPVRLDIRWPNGNERNRPVLAV